MRKIMVNVIFATMVIFGNIFTAQRDRRRAGCFERFVRKFVPALFVSTAIVGGTIILSGEKQPIDPARLRLLQDCHGPCLKNNAGQREIQTQAVICYAFCAEEDVTSGCMGKCMKSK